MKGKRTLRGGLREYKRHGIFSLVELTVWYTSRNAMPGLRSFYHTYRTRDVERYDLPLDPYSLMWVDPGEIRHKTNRERPRWTSFVTNVGSVKGGDWDIHLEKGFSFRHRSFKAHFERGVPWEDTEFYKKSMGAIEKGEYGMRMSASEEEVKERCREIDELHLQMKKHGYKSQTELGDYSTKLDQLANEIQIDIGRDGSLLFVEGRHRLSLAKILDIDAIPVITVCRHKQWIERLEDHYRRGEGVAHPDWNNVQP